MCLSPASSLYQQELEAEILYPVGNTEITPDPSNKLLNGRTFNSNLVGMQLSQNFKSFNLPICSSKILAPQIIKKSVVSLTRSEGSLTSSENQPMGILRPKYSKSPPYPHSPATHPNWEGLFAG